MLLIIGLLGPRDSTHRRTRTAAQAMSNCAIARLNSFFARLLCRYFCNCCPSRHHTETDKNAIVANNASVEPRETHKDVVWPASVEAVAIARIQAFGFTHCIIQASIKYIGRM